MEFVWLTPKLIWKALISSCKEYYFPKQEEHQLFSIKRKITFSVILYHCCIKIQVYWKCFSPAVYNEWRPSIWILQNCQGIAMGSFSKNPSNRQVRSKNAVSCYLSQRNTLKDRVFEWYKPCSVVIVGCKENHYLPSRQQPLAPLSRVPNTQSLQQTLNVLI